MSPLNPGNSTPGLALLAGTDRCETLAMRDHSGITKVVGSEGSAAAQPRVARRTGVKRGLTREC